MSMIKGIILKDCFDEDLSDFIDKNKRSSRDLGLLEGEVLIGEKFFKNCQQFRLSHAFD